MANISGKTLNRTILNTSQSFVLILT